MVGWRNKKSGKFFTIAMKTFSIIQTYIKLLLPSLEGEAGERTRWQSCWLLLWNEVIGISRRWILRLSRDGFCCVALPTSSSPSPNAKMTLNIHSHFRSAKNEQKIHKYYNVKNDEKDTTQQQTAEKFPTNEINFGISGLAWSNLSEFSELRCPKMIVKENSNFIDFHRRCWDDVALYLRVLWERCSVN